LGVSEL
jgi:hypothetical protein